MTYRVFVALHVLGATVWVGGHLVLCLAVLPRALRSRDPRIVSEFESGFERLGIPALALQALTGLWLASHWVPNIAEWLSPSTPQARLIFLKLLLLIVTVALGLHARLRVLPTLDAEKLHALAYHIVLVTLVGVGMLLVGVAIRTGAAL